MLRTLIISCIAFCSTQAISISRRAFCGGGDNFLTQNNGVISSHVGMAQNHTYGRNLDCSWKIEAPEGMKVELVAQTFDIEADSTCDYDYVILYDGRDATSSSLGKFCGTSFNPITSTGRFMTVRFVTDGDTQGTGFQFFYNFTTSDVHICKSGQFVCANGKCISNTYRCDNADDCGDDSDEQNCAGYSTSGTSSSTTCASDKYNCHTSVGCIPKDWLCDGDDDCGNGVDEQLSTCRGSISDARCGALNQTGESGTISSPNYPSSYGASTRCFYSIQAPAGTQNIAFKFDGTFHVEPDSTCDYDFVKIYSDNRANMHGPYCGNTAPQGFTITGDHAFVEFMSDNSDQYSGFRLDWRSLV